MQGWVLKAGHPSSETNPRFLSFYPPGSLESMHRWAKVQMQRKKSSINAMFELVQQVTTRDQWNHTDMWDHSSFKKVN